MMEWLDEQDPELLQATLAMVGDWCSSQDPQLRRDAVPSRSPSLHQGDNTSGSGSDASTREDATPKAPKPTRTVNIGREKRKKEIAELKQLAFSLSQRLNGLKQQRERQLRAHYQGGSIVSAAPVWEKMARRQFEGRKRAELANAQLRRDVSVHKQIVYELMLLLRRAEQERKNGLVMPSVSRVRLPVDVNLRLTEEEQLRRIEWLCQQTQTVFAQDDRFSGRLMEFYDSRVVVRTSGEVVIEVCACAAAPFSVNHVARVIWAIWLMEAFGDEDEEFVQHTLRATNDTIQGVFTAWYRTSGVRGTFNGKFVTRRIAPTPTQRAVVSHTYSEPEGYHADVDGVVLSDDSWMRQVDARELGHANLTGPLTLMQHVRRCRISLRHLHEDPRHVEKLTKFFETQIRDEILWAYQGFENCLMQPKQLMPGPCDGTDE